MYSTNNPKTPFPAQPAVTKLTTTPKTVTTKASAIGKKTAQLAPKTTASNPVKTVTPLWKPTPTVTGIDTQHDKEVVIVAEGNEVTLTEDKIGNLL